MSRHTIRVSEKAYSWISDKSAILGGSKLSSSKIIDILILHFDHTYDKYVVTDETKKLQQRLAEITLSMEHLLEEKRHIIEELDDSIITRREEIDGDDDDDLFEDEPEVKTKLNPHEKMMKTKIF